MKSNFRPNKPITKSEDDLKSESNSKLTKEEFEEFVSKSGAAGSFMIFRSTKKDDELGIDEL